MNFLGKVLAIVCKDIAAELRTHEMVTAMLVFAILATLIFSFALDLQGNVARAAAPGVLWATVAFAGNLGLSRSLAKEQENGCLDGLLMLPADRSVIFFGKATGNLVFMLVVEIVLLPLFSLLFDVSLLQPEIVLITVLGTIGYAAAGTLLASIAINTRSREIMLPVLLLPLAVPQLIAAVRATGWILDGGTLAEAGSWVRLLVAYDLIIVAVSMLAYSYVVEE